MEPATTCSPWGKHPTFKTRLKTFFVENDGLAVLVNNKLCFPGHVSEKCHLYNPDIELLAVSINIICQESLPGILGHCWHSTFSCWQCIVLSSFHLLLWYRHSTPLHLRQYLIILIMPQSCLHLKTSKSLLKPYNSMASCDLFYIFRGRVISGHLFTIIFKS